MARYAGVLCALALVGGASAARAQGLDLERGWYYEIGFGRASFDVKTADLDAVPSSFFDSFGLPVQTITSTVDRRDRSYALFTGYHFNRYIAAEVGYFRLGAFKYASTGTVNDTGTLHPDSFWFTYRVKGVLFGGAATLPLGGLVELRGRAGISSTDTRIRYAGTVESDTLSDEFSDSSQDLYFGAGVGVNVWRFYRIGIDWMRHKNLGRASSTGTTDASDILLSIGFHY